MNRRSFLTSLPWAATALRAAASPPPNIVLILADDLGWSDLGCYGSDLHQTPNLDAMARRGIRFTEAYAAAPICSPTRASIMTGKHPARLGMTIWREGSLRPPDRKLPLLPPPSEPDLAQSDITLAEALKPKGYLTTQVGKWHLGDADHSAQANGFDIGIGGTHWGAPQTYFYPYRGNKRFGEFRYVPGLDFGRPGEYLTDRLTDEALRVIDYAGSQPFFLYLAHHAPHTPIEGKSEIVRRYQERIKAGMKHRNAAYAAMVESLDDSVGRVAAHLKQRKLDQNTLLVFMSDNGGYINPFDGEPVTNNAPLRSGKGSLYEGGVRVPMIFSGAGVGRQGAVEPTQVMSTDIYRTILDAAGLGGSDGYLAAADSVSLAPLIGGQTRTLGRSQLCFHYPHYYATTTPASAIRVGGWKLIEYFEGPKLELYDLASDPSESRDLASVRPDIARDLAARLKAWREEVGARLPVKNPDYRA
ncbi:MAG TPA: sulfatase [Bryobacteraceae bacterium]|nr:sulfatase [Bryobacteraceae bacterium]